MYAQQQATSNKHVSVSFWPLHLPNASGLAPHSPSWSLRSVLAKSTFGAETSPLTARGSGARSGGALPNLGSFGPKTAIFRPKQP